MVQMKKQKGFTLIELIIVIIILGILAVTAAPKFLDVQNDAKQSALEGIAGAVRSASQIAHSGALIGSSATQVALEGVNYGIDNDYLTATEVCRVVGLVDAVVVAGTPQTSNDGGYTCTLTAATATDGAIITIAPTGIAAANAANCVLTYQDTTDTNDARVNVSISATTSNCS